MSLQGVSLSEDEYEEYVKNELDIAKDMEQRYTIDKLKSMKIDFNSSPYFLEVDGTAQTNDYAVYGLCISYAALNADYVNVMTDIGNTVLEDKLELFAKTDDYCIPDIKFEDLIKLEKKLNFRELAEDYYNLSEYFKQTNFSCLDTADKMESLLSLDGEFKSFVETLGIEAIRATGFHKTKTKAKFDKTVGVDSKTVKQKRALKKLKLKVGNFYTYTELRDKVKSVYDSEGISNGAKATDINTIYVTKKTARNKVQGFLIVSKI